MTRLARAWIILPLSLLSACFERDNCDGKPARVEGEYRGMQDAQLTVHGDEVVVTYQREDGSRWRARLHVVSRERATGSLSD
jgi:hypothetical protein